MKLGEPSPGPGIKRQSGRGRLLLAISLAIGLAWAGDAPRAGGIPGADARAEEATRPPVDSRAAAQPPAESAPATSPPAEAPPAPDRPAPDGPAREIPDPIAVLPKGDAAVEYWDLTMELDSGHHLFVRFAITNEGPGDQIGFATGELVDPDGNTTHFRNGRQKSRWTLSRDRLRLDIGKSHLDLHGPLYRLEIAKSYVNIDLSFPLRAGMPIPPGIAPGGYAVDLLALASPTTGTIWLKGMSNGLKVQGQTAAVHTVVRKSETKLVRRRIELFLQQRDTALYVADFTAPSGKRSRWLRALDARRGPEQGDQLISETAFDIELGGNLFRPGAKGAKKAKKDYWVAGHLGLSGNAVSGEATLTEALVQRDPLSDLPQPLRFLAGRRSSPRRVWSAANFAVTLQPGSGPTPLQFQNRGVAAINFTNPLTRR